MLLISFDAITMLLSLIAFRILFSVVQLSKNDAPCMALR